jgi:uncharacterized protein with HEPN domain
MIKNRDSVECSSIVAVCDTISHLLDKYDKSFDVFCSDPGFRDVCKYYVVLIGESVKRISVRVKYSKREFCWNDFVSVSDSIINNFGVVDADSVWNLVFQEIPRLRDICIGLALGFDSSEPQMVSNL